MKPRRVGKVQRGVRRGLIWNDGVPQSTPSLLRWCYPRVTKFTQDHYRALAHAAPRFAIKLGRSEHGQGRPNLWAPRPELLRAIRGEDHDA